MDRFLGLKAAVAAMAIGTALGAFAPGWDNPARADDLKVYSPIVEEGEFAFETRGHVYNDSDDDQDGESVQRFALEYAPTSWWLTAVYGNFEKEAGGDFEYEATAWENIFQIFPQGSHWLDLGFYVEYEMAAMDGSPDELELKLLAEKNVGHLTFTVNPILEKELGANAEESTEFAYAARAKWRWMPELEPAIEAFGEIGEISDPEPMDEQRHQVGPVLLGKLPLGNRSALKYEAGYLFGLTEGSPDGAFKWLLEFEHHF